MQREEDFEGVEDRADPRCGQYAPVCHRCISEQSAFGRDIGLRSQDCWRFSECPWHCWGRLWSKTKRGDLQMS